MHHYLVAAFDFGNARPDLLNHPAPFVPEEVWQMTRVPLLAAYFSKLSTTDSGGKYPYFNLAEREGQQGYRAYPKWLI